MNKNIAIFGWKIGENSFGITVPYYNYFSYFGDVHILSPLKSFDFTKYDLLVVPGGPDVAPSTYGMIPDMYTGKSDPIREYFDKFQLPLAIKTGIPLVGICRGHQSICVAFDGYLNQNMQHETNLSTDRNKAVHGLNVFTEVLPESLAKTLRDHKEGLPKYKDKHLANHPTRRYLEVNSIHHQTVAEVPEAAMLLATYNGEKENSIDGLSIEALYYPNHNIFTFQYHPEELWDDLSLACVTYLLNHSHKEHESSENNLELTG